MVDCRLCVAYVCSSSVGDGVLYELNFSTRSGKSGVMASETELIEAQDSYLIMAMEASY